MSSQDISSQFGSSQIKSRQVNSSWDRSNQVMTGQVKLELFKSDPRFFLTQNFWIQNFLDPNFLLELKLLWTQHFFGPKIFLGSKCTWEWSLTLALAQLVSLQFFSWGDPSWLWSWSEGEFKLKSCLEETGEYLQVVQQKVYFFWFLGFRGVYKFHLRHFLAALSV